MRATRCKGQTLDGRPCRNYPIRGSEYCRHHQPEDVKSERASKLRRPARQRQREEGAKDLRWLLEKLWRLLLSALGAILGEVFFGDLVDNIKNLLGYESFIPPKRKPTPTPQVMPSLTPTPQVTPSPTPSPVPSASGEPITRERSMNVLARVREEIRDFLTEVDKEVLIPIPFAVAEKILEDRHERKYRILWGKGNYRQMVAIDSNGDGIPDIYLSPDGQVDIDGDGKPDGSISDFLTEEGFLDVNGDGIPDFRFHFTPDGQVDIDGDGKPDGFISDFLTEEGFLDIDGDGIPDF